ncbi:MAG: MBL fold metallo-hydrolase [Myxococcaceae bacterium]
MNFIRLLVPLMLLSAACSKPSRAPVIAQVPPQAAPVEVSGGGGREVAVTRVVHSSLLIELGGGLVLTDPWFTETSQYRTGEPVGIALESLPKLTAVIASHDHYDHFDVEAFAAYPDKGVPFIVGPGMAEAARRVGFTDVRELRPWESTKVGDLEITAAPGAHGVEEITFVLQADGNTVYFAGDTRLIPELDQIAERFPSIQLALLPVNGLHAFWMQQVMTDEEAAKLAATLKAEVAVPHHYRFQGGWFTQNVVLTYHGSAEGFAEHAARLTPETRVRILQPGERLPILTGK